MKLVDDIKQGVYAVGGSEKSMGEGDESNGEVPTP